MDYKAIEDLKRSGVEAGNVLSNLFEKLGNLEKTVPKEHVNEYNRLKDQEPTIKEAQEALKNLNVDFTKW